jgi:hypothetical protein
MKRHKKETISHEELIQGLLECPVTQLEVKKLNREEFVDLDARLALKKEFKKTATSLKAP